MIPKTYKPHSNEKFIYCKTAERIPDAGLRCWIGKNGNVRLCGNKYISHELTRFFLNVKPTSITLSERDYARLELELSSYQRVFDPNQSVDRNTLIFHDVEIRREQDRNLGFVREE